ncbi:MAG TPA: anaerobic glycerol-3-phosphate dehydrogenase subunit B [Desulfobacteraceae bacterium]|nr:anaerobic glycerol-3-phosphate dehydrogenase subunit B [Desulfobacteraceae bacterium]
MTRECDLLIIGAGLAGMTAAARAADKGLSCVVAGNPSSLMFASGLMDYLGVYPAGNSQVLETPEEGLADLTRDLPGHIYAVTGHDAVQDSFEFVRGVLAEAGLAYTLGNGNQMLLTTMGTVKPSFMVPETMAAGVLNENSGNQKLLVAGIQGLQGFSPVQVAEGGAEMFGDTRSVQTELPGIQSVVPPQALAEMMSDPDIQDRFITQVRPQLKSADLCGVPAVMGGLSCGAVMSRLRDAFGIPVFEIPGGPPSIPGLRLKQAFESLLATRHIPFLSNMQMADPVFDGRYFSLSCDQGIEEVTVRSRGVILATGRFFGNGLHARRERVVETLFRLDVVQPNGRNLWHENLFLAPEGHRINQAGIRTDDRFRPLDERDRPVYENLYAVGSILAWNDWARLKSGSGAALASACRAVDAFADSIGGGA